MSVRVTAESWERGIKLGCRLFGHVWRDGWWGDLPYASVGTRGEDNVGRKHGVLSFECDRCGKAVMFGRIHTNSEVLRRANLPTLPDSRSNEQVEARDA